MEKGSGEDEAKRERRGRKGRQDVHAEKKTIA